MADDIDKRHITARVDVSTIAELDKIAAARRTTRSWLVVEAINAFLHAERTGGARP